jgi:agmatinase
LAGHATTKVVGQTDAQATPRFAGLTTFARLPRLDQVPDYDVAIAGVPFDAGCTYRSGARFGPAHIRQASRLLRPYHLGLGVAPFEANQVVDAGDLSANPFNIPQALEAVSQGAAQLIADGRRLVALGGDHTITLPLLRAVAQRHGPLAVLHFDSHLDTWGTYFGAEYTHGSPFRRASEEGLIDRNHSIHVGIHGSVYAESDLSEDTDLGFSLIPSEALEEGGVGPVVQRIRDRVGDQPLYISTDIDVIDVGMAPGTGTPEAGGLLTRELLLILRGLRGLQLAGADLVEVCPAYDHAEVTGIAAAHVVYEYLALMATEPRRLSNESLSGHQVQH